jgi:hypothetical protein
MDNEVTRKYMTDENEMLWTGFFYNKKDVSTSSHIEKDQKYIDLTSLLASMEAPHLHPLDLEGFSRYNQKRNFR